MKTIETAPRRPSYGWVVLLVAASAMVATLPGRTQGLGLITEPLLKDLRFDRVHYANINLWATLIGAVICIPIGRVQDRLGSRAVLAIVGALLGATVIAMSRATAAQLFVLITLTRALGQSALSVVSLTMVGQWFRKGLDKAMAIFTVVMTIGFMIAFPVVQSLVERAGWRPTWAGVGWAILLLVPLAILVRHPPTVVEGEEAVEASEGHTLVQAMQTSAFWIMGLSSAFYGLIASGIGLFNESVLAERGMGADVYRGSLAVTALTALIGNFLGGYLAAKGSMNRLMAVAMLLLMLGLAALPNLTTSWQVMAVAVLMGVAGGFVMVLFFSFWGRVYGRAYLGQIQGAAQTLTVLASAIGPVLLAQCVHATGSYSSAFYALALTVAILSTACWIMKNPASA